MARSLNSKPKSDDNIAGMIDGKKVSDYRDRIARLMEEQKAIGEDIKEIAMQCSDAGVATIKEIRKLARESLMDQDVLRDQLERMDLLRHALGAFGNTPLGEATISRGAQAETEAPAPSRRRKPKGQTAIEKAQAHLNGGEQKSPEEWMDEELDRIIDEHPPSAA